MKKILSGIIIIICSNYTFGQVFFEGIITFEANITTSKLAPENLKENLKNNYGDSLLVFYNQNGHFTRRYLNTGEYGNNYQTYYKDSGELYILTKGRGIDTLDVSKNSLQIVSKRVDKKKVKIMDMDCDCIIYNALDKDSNEINLEYCFSPKIKKLNSGQFENHKDFFLYDFFYSSNSPYLKFKMKTKEFELTFTAKELEEKWLTEGDIKRE